MRSVIIKTALIWLYWTGYIFFTIPFTAYGQKIPIRNYTTETGLPQAQISSVTQDSKGFIWFISSSGLTRYDGTEFRTYTKQDGLTSNIGIDIREDKTGNLWALMVNGIAVLDIANDGYIRSARKIETRNGLPNLENTCMYLDRDGFLWIGTRNGGVVRLQIENVNGNYTVTPLFTIGQEQGLGSDAVTTIFQDKDNRFWIGTEKGLSVIEFNSSMIFVLTRFTQKNGLGSDHIRCIAQNPAGEIWVGTRSGLSKMVDIIGSPNPIKFRNFTTAAGLLNNDIHGIAVDNPGNLWIATAKGISKLNFSEFHDRFDPFRQDNFTVSNYTSENGLIDNVCRSVFADRENNIWIPTYGGGVSKISTEKFHTLSMTEGLVDNTPGPLLEDLSGRIWIGTNNGLSVIEFNPDPTASNRYNAVKPDRSAGQLYRNIQDFTMDHNGTILIATDDGVFRYSNSAFIPYVDKRDLSNPDVRQIEHDNKGNLWIGTVSGLNRFSGNKNQIFMRKEGLPNDYIRKILKDHRGNLWIGTNNGLCRVDHDEVFKPHPKLTRIDKIDLPEKIINDLYEDRLHQLWIGSDDALLRVELNENHEIKEWTRINMKEAGFSNTKIRCINQDASGYLWITTGRGLYQLDPEKISVVNVYYKSDGLAGNEGAQGNAMIVDKDGTIWMSFFGGVTRYLPKVDFEYARTVPSYIRKFAANDVSYPIDQPIRLNYNDRNIEISFAGLLFRNEESLNYQYRLDGYDRDWSPLTSSRQVRYTNLDDGSYTFRYRTVSFHQKESHSIVELAFVIRPPFWKQWWFFVLAPFLAGSLGYFVYHNRIKFIQKRNAELEYRIHLRTQEVKKQNDEINRQRTVLQQQKNELENTIRELTKTQTDLIHSKKMASLVQIVAGIAHEVNNPLANIYGNATHLKEYIANLEHLLQRIDRDILYKPYRTVEELEAAKSEIHQFKETIDYDYLLKDIHNILTSVEKSSNRMMQIVKDLRKFSRLDESEIKEVNINDTLGNIAELFLSQYRFSIEIEKVFSLLPPMLCYPHELSQAFMQIMLNAAQAILEYQEYALQEIKNENSTIQLDPDRGRIRIETRLIESTSLKDLELSLQEIDSGIRIPIIQIKIRDDGIGIANDIRDKVFDPFFTTRKIGDGIGLGLSVAYSIIEKHRGRIFFNSERLNGTEFIIELPVRNNL